MMIPATRQPVSQKCLRSTQSKVRFAQRQKRSRAIAMASASALVPVANGSEEMESVIIIDTLRRADVDVVVASVEQDPTITASRNVKLTADTLIDDCKGPYDVIAVPGGMPGAQRLHENTRLAELLADQKYTGRLVAAICAAPAVVLKQQGLLDGLKATSHPGFVEKLEDQSKAEERVVVDSNVVTSRGPGTAFEFALKIIEILLGKAKAEEVAGPMVMYKY